MSLTGRYVRPSRNHFVFFHLDLYERTIKSASGKMGRSERPCSKEGRGRGGKGSLAGIDKRQQSRPAAAMT